MNNTTKTILIIAGTLVVLCACTASILFATGLWSVGQIVNWADTSTTRDLYEVADMASEVAVFTLPEGFSSPYGMHFGEITSIGFASRSNNTHILITQFPQGSIVNTDEMLKMISKYSVEQDSRWADTHTTIIQEKPVTIRGQETTLTISEGTSSDGTAYRTATATFQGKGGPALVMIAGPLDEWDLEMVETFIASIQ